MSNSSNSHSQLSIFDELDRETKQTTDQIESEVRLWMAESVPCFFCGEKMPRGIMSFNHGIVFNGWCMKALAYHMRSKGRLHTHTVEAAWLMSHGIDPHLDSHDESHWRNDLRELHYEAHFGNCYRWEGCK